MKNRNVVAGVLAAALSMGAAAVAVAGPAHLPSPSASAWYKVDAGGSDVKDYKYDSSNADKVDVMNRIVWKVQNKGLKGGYSATELQAVMDILGTDDYSELELNEVGGLSVAATANGTTKITLGFPTVYAPGSTVAVSFGVADANGNVSWVIVEGTVNDDGQVEFEMTADQVAALAGGNAVYGVINLTGDTAEA